MRDDTAAEPPPPPPRLLSDHAVIRLVPRVEREEFVNVGVILSCPARRFLDARIEPDWPLVDALAGAAVDREVLGAHLEAIVRICAGDADAGPIARLPQRERFHFLTARRSTVIQTSPVHTGRTLDPAACLDDLMQRLVRRKPRPGPGAGR